MVTVFSVCAVLGTVIMLCQLVMTLVGADVDDVDAPDIGELGDDLEMGDDFVDGHPSANLFFEALSIRSLIAAVAFFGLGGLAAEYAGMSAYSTFVCAVGAGVVAMFFVAWIMRLLMQLKSSGTVRIEQCVGHEGTVYLTVPGNKSGAGKVTVMLSDRTMEFPAVTNTDAIPTGSRVVVVDVSGPSTLEVKPAEG